MLSRRSSNNNHHLHGIVSNPHENMRSTSVATTTTTGISVSSKQCATNYWVPPPRSTCTTSISSSSKNFNAKRSSTRLQQQNSLDTILVEDSPKFTQWRKPLSATPNVMGGPVMTSTPTYNREQQQQDEQDDDEPIYCEINSPLKTNLRRGPLPPERSTQQHDRFVKRQAGDFSRMKIENHNNNNNKSTFQKNKFVANYAPIEINNRPTTKGLGRRAVTQVDMIVNRNQSNDNNFNFARNISSRNNGNFVSNDKRSQMLLSSRNLNTAENDLVSRHPLGMLNHYQQANQRYQNFITQKNECCYSDYGFSNNHDDSTSTVTTTNTATTNNTACLVNATTVRKGLLWQQRDKIFSRWKERFFILTSEYLQCFKKATSQISEMGGFIFKVKLSDIEEIELVDKKGYLTICLALARETGNKILLRKPEGIREWFQILKECVERSKERRGLMKSTKEFWAKKQFTDSSSMEQWITARKRIEMKYAYSETDSCVSSSHQQQPARNRKRDLSRSNLNVTLKNPVTTTDYGFIDVPLRNAHKEASSSRTDLHSNFSREEVDYCTSPLSSSDAFMKKIIKDSSSTFSQDSGVDSMNTNSSGSVMSRQTTPPNVPTSSSSVFTTARTTTETIRAKSRIPTLAKNHNSPDKQPVKPSRFYNYNDSKHSSSRSEQNIKRNHISLV